MVDWGRHSECWKLVEPGYWVSDQGRVYSEARIVACGAVDGKPHTRRKAGRILAMNLSPPGYYRVNINRKVVHVHRLVAMAFLGSPPDGKPTVNHKDLDKTNNSATNLEWLSSGDNVRHAWNGGAHSPHRVVRCIDTGDVYRSVHEAARAHALTPGNLCTHLKGDQHTFAGKRWEYAECPEWPKRQRGDA